ncbi:hypothetical protein [Leptospira sp. GIMC2001]|uniref:hypothetical protein n=1 Tax=Leptospira sp. GIMC2001 TaxID=1513297 RepID=UPI002349408D|nr:hypothetical protein [Leptospira sp. GIMC2001]WCL50739.1 hypothetical protein O4O04_07985 [Leptospira sp. GIMC2001]
MLVKEIKGLIPKEVRIRFRENFENYPEKANLFYQSNTVYLDETNISDLIILLSDDKFLDYIRKRKNTPEGRLNFEFDIISSLLSQSINPYLLAEVLKTVSESKVLSIYRRFFKIPVDEITASEFLKNAIRVGVHDLDRMFLYSEFFNSTNFYEISGLYDNKKATGYINLLSYHRNLYISSLPIESILESEDFLGQPAIIRALKLAYLNGEKILIESIFKRFIIAPFPAETGFAMKVLNKRYRNPSGTNKKIDTHFYERTMQCFPVIEDANQEILNDFKSFLETYGNPRDPFETFVWNEVFRLPKEKIPFVLSLFTSYSFISLKTSYQTDPKILLFLIRNILTAISDIKIRNIESGLRKIILKLLITLKPDKRFMRRRGEFLYILKKTNSSLRLEMEFIRLFFFDYIFEAFKRTGAIDSFHASFLNYIDKLYPKLLTQRIEFPQKMSFVLPLIEEGRLRLYSPFLEKFVAYNDEMKELMEVAFSCDLDDLFLEEFEKLDVNSIPDYHSDVMDAFKRNPAFVAEAAIYDYHCAVRFEDALPFIRSQTTFLVGGIEICAGVRGAYTYGNSIYLPEKLNHFKDPKYPLEENRNLTLFVGLGLHEASHIIFGSFNFDLNRYTYKLEKPTLFKTIHNITEDFRIEKYLLESKLISISEDVIPFMNIVFSIANWQNEDRSIAFLLLSYISEMASGIWDKIVEECPEAEIRLQNIFNLPLSKGRFRSIEDMSENWIERLKNMKHENPLSAVPISIEIYEVLSYWQLEFLHDLDEQEPIEKGTHGAGGTSPPKGPASPNHPQSPLSKEDLQALYEDYNNNPQKYRESIQENITALKSRDFLQPINDEEIFEVEEISYEEEGTADVSTRTKADEQLAEDKKEGLFDKIKEKLTKKVKRKGAGKKTIRSLSPHTNSKTRLVEIKEVPIKNEDKTFLTALSHFKDVEIEIEKQLARYIRPNEILEQELNAYEGEIDMEELIEILSGREKVGFFEFLEADLSTAKKTSLEVVIGMDMSGSTGGIADSNMGLTILDVEKVFAMLFGKALEVFAEKISYMGFDSLTSTNVYKAKNRLCVSSFHSGGSNRDGDFIRFVKEYLKKSKHELKYFFFLSDGQPSGVNYDGASALSDTILAMQEVLNDKIRLVYLNVDSEKNSYFDDFAKVATYAEHFSKPTDLIPKIPELVRTLAKAVY